jgi:hypothetical protein
MSVQRLPAQVDSLRRELEDRPELSGEGGGPAVEYQEVGGGWAGLHTRHCS